MVDTSTRTAFNYSQGSLSTNAIKYQPVNRIHFSERSRTLFPSNSFKKVPTEVASNCGKTSQPINKIVSKNVADSSVKTPLNYFKGYRSSAKYQPDNRTFAERTHTSFPSNFSKEFPTRPVSNCSKISQSITTIAISNLADTSVTTSVNCFQGFKFTTAAKYQDLSRESCPERSQTLLPSNCSRTSQSISTIARYYLADTSVTTALNSSKGTRSISVAKYQPANRINCSERSQTFPQSNFLTKLPTKVASNCCNTSQTITTVTSNNLAITSVTTAFNYSQGSRSNTVATYHPLTRISYPESSQTLFPSNYSKTSQSITTIARCNLTDTSVTTTHSINL